MDTTAEIWATTVSMAMWHAFTDEGRALCRSNIRPHSHARFTWAETNRAFSTPRPHCEGCRKKLAAQAAEQAAPVEAAPAPVDRRPEVVIPGALADILSESNLATGADDHDPASKATREALDAGRRGRGRTLVIRPGSTDVLDVISEYADTVLNCAEEYTDAEIKAARTWVDRAGHARKHYAEATQAQQAEPTIEAVDPRAYLRAAVLREGGEWDVARVTALFEAAELDVDRATRWGFLLNLCEDEHLLTPFDRRGTFTAVPAADVERAAAFASTARAVDAVEHAEETGAAVDTVEDAEALYAVAVVTEAEADGGTWRGEWIGEESTAPTLFDVEQPEQGALFTEAAPAEQSTALVARVRFEPVALAQHVAKAAADRTAYRAEMDARKAAEAARYGTPAQGPDRCIAEGVIVQHTGTSEGSTPRHATHPNVRAAREALSGLAVARLTDHHDVHAPTEEEQAVRGYMIEPRGGRRVAVYWLEAGRTIRHDDPWHGASLDCLAHRLTSRGWTVESMLTSSHCLFAHQPE